MQELQHVIKLTAYRCQETQISGRLCKSGGRSPRHAHNPLGLKKIIYVPGNLLFRNRVGRSVFLLLDYTLLGDAHVGYFCAAKQNKQILHKQYRFSYCAPIRMLKKSLASKLLFIDKKNKGRQILKIKTGSTPKIRVGRVAENKQFFCFGHIGRVKENALNNPPCPIPPPSHHPLYIIHLVN